MLKLNGQEINVTIFPDKSSQIWKLSESVLKENLLEVEWEFENEAEIIHLAQLKTLIDKYNPTLNHLYIDYLPYARQDKEVTNESTFALRTFATILNSLRFDGITISDPHSQAALELINNSHATYPIEQILHCLDVTKTELFCYPDKGAVHKYVNIYEFPYVYADKVRDQLTGNILSHELKGDVNNKTILIVDDICDGGATFIKLTELLLNNGAKEVNLFVTHGMFSKGIKVLKDAGIKRIFTKNGEQL